MSSALVHSMFQDVLFPIKSSDDNAQSSDLHLRKALRFQVNPGDTISDMPLVIFDFETTGLDSELDRIIEIGAIKVKDGKLGDQYSTLVSTDIPIPEVVQTLTGITPDMLIGQPGIDKVLPEFLTFIKGSVLVAHNAEFDMGMLKAACSRDGIDLDWPAFCTLKMARELLPELEQKNLDTLAKHYGLTFESRHRSIGDVKVTAAVLKEFLSSEGAELKTWKHLQAFYVS